MFTFTGANCKIRVNKINFINESLCKDRVQEGIRELEILKDKRDVNLCSTMALMFAHKKSPNVGEYITVFVTSVFTFTIDLQRKILICTQCSLDSGKLSKIRF